MVFLMANGQTPKKITLTDEERRKRSLAIGEQVRKNELDFNKMRAAELIKKKPSLLRSMTYGAVVGAVAFMISEGWNAQEAVAVAKSRVTEQTVSKYLTEEAGRKITVDEAKVKEGASKYRPGWDFKIPLTIKSAEAGVNGAMWGALAGVGAGIVVGKRNEYKAFKLVQSRKLVRPFWMRALSATGSGIARGSRATMGAARKIKLPSLRRRKA
jgi:hypothetical protein